MYDKMLLLRQRMSNGIISLLGNFARGGLETQITVGAGLPAIAVWRGCLVGYISIAAVTAAYGFALTAGHFSKDR
ncbi:hypothetical protein FEM54_24380, partial [Pseudomonas edaphica]